MMKTTIAALFLGALCLTGLPSKAAAENLYPGQYLYAGQRLVAGANCFYHLDMQSDGNLVLYAGGTPYWATNTAGRGAYALMQRDGNFVVNDWNNRAVWATNTWGHPYNFLAMQGDANLVVYDGSVIDLRPGAPQYQALWASNTWTRYPVGQTPCYLLSKKTTTDPNWDHAGGDYALLKLNGWGPTLCEYKCATDSRCKAFTFVPTGTYTADCWLKNVVMPLVYRPGLTTGTIYTSNGG